MTEDRKAFIMSKSRVLPEHEQNKLIEEEHYKTLFRSSMYSPESIDPEKEKELAEIEISENEYKRKIGRKHLRPLEVGEKIWGEE